MKPYCKIVTVLLLALVISGCAINLKMIYPAYMQEDLLKEDWIFHVNLKPSRWLDLPAPPHYGKSETKIISLPEFFYVKTNGHFNVEITTGGTDHRLQLTGPANETPSIIVKILNGTLYVYQDPRFMTQHVTVRIALPKLRSLCNCGSSNIYANRFSSNNLSLFSSGSGNIYLNGRMNIKKLTQLGPGTITIRGAYTPSLDLTVLGNGNVNIGGRVGVRSIRHFGNGEVNILCADTDCLNVMTAGDGLTTVLGCVSVKSIVAADNSRVYIFWVNSKNVSVQASKCAYVGLAGSAFNLNVCLFGCARFAGSYLRAESAYVATNDDSHGNIFFTDKLFVNTTGTSTVYYYGPTNNVSRYLYNDSAVIPVGLECIPHRKLFVSINLPCRPIPLRQIYP